MLNFLWIYAVALSLVILWPALRRWIYYQMAIPHTHEWINGYFAKFYCKRCGMARFTGRP